MTRIASAEGLWMCQHGEASPARGMRFIGVSRNQTWGGTQYTLRFTISNSNPYLHVRGKSFSNWRNTSNINTVGDSYVMLRWTTFGFVCNTGGGIEGAGAGGDKWGNANEGPSIANTATRQVDFGFYTIENGIMTVYHEIFCTRWDFVTLSVVPA